MQHAIFGATITLEVVSVDEMEIPILGRTYVRYTATMPDGAVFTGHDFSPAPSIKPADGIASALELLSFLCLKPGDTDDEHLADYTPAQLAWSESNACESMQMYVDEAIVLTDIEGIARLSGTDQNGLQWVQFEVDYFAEQEPGECSVCEREIENDGWLCGDGGDEVCNDHIYFADKAEAERRGWTWIGAPL